MAAGWNDDKTRALIEVWGIGNIQRLLLMEEESLYL